MVSSGRYLRVPVASAHWLDKAEAPFSGKLLGQLLACVIEFSKRIDVGKNRPGRAEHYYLLDQQAGLLCLVPAAWNDPGYSTRYLNTASALKD